MHHLGNGMCTMSQKARDDGGVLLGDEAFQDSRAVHHGDTRNRDVVLHCHPLPTQQTAFSPAANLRSHVPYKGSRAQSHLRAGKGLNQALWVLSPGSGRHQRR